MKHSTSNVVGHPTINVSPPMLNESLIWRANRERQGGRYLTSINGTSAQSHLSHVRINDDFSNADVAAQLA